MADVAYFVGRQGELEQFDGFLRDPAGQAALIVGQVGMGKTTLAKRMAPVAENHPDLKCGWVRYEVTRTDPPAATMALMIDHAFEAGQRTAGSFDPTDQRLRQWRALLNVLRIGDLVMSLRRDPQRDTRTQFVDRLALVSRRMPDDARAIFIVDSDKYMPEGSADDWRLVVQKVPERIKFLFAQRPEDQLVRNADFRALPNVVSIPRDDLSALDEKAVEQLIDHHAPEVNASPSELRAALQRYHGHPYAIDGAFKLLAAGRSLDELPADPTPPKIAAEQWRKVAECGPDAVRLFKAYAVLEVAVPFEVVQAVAKADVDTRLALLADPYLGGLLNREGEWRRIYHALLADHIRSEIGPDEGARYHERAVEEYRRRLKADVKPDALAATRLPEHVLALGDTERFVWTFVRESSKTLFSLGLLDDFISLSRRALSVAAPRSEGQAALTGNLGNVLRTRGDLDGAEQMFRKALEINDKLGRLGGMANQYGNLGNVLLKRGDLDGAEAMYRKALEIDEKLGRLEGVANAYGGLGIVLQIRGDLDGAEMMNRKALEIDEKLGRLEGMAHDYGNLGIVVKRRGDLDGAEAMYRKALEIDEKLGHLEGIASGYANLGVVLKTRGDVGGARECWTKARDLYAKIGMPHTVEKVQKWLDELDAKERGE